MERERGGVEREGGEGERGRDGKRKIGRIEKVERERERD